MKEFRFGLETEYLLADKVSGRPLWHSDVTFEQLHYAMEQIPLEGIPSLEGLSLEPCHSKLMPCIIEGYQITNSKTGAIDFLPKGIEIRTPICRSIHECLQTFETLFVRMQEVLLPFQIHGVALSHHPVETHFEGPQEHRTYEFWQWAKQAMLTYGPDVNISLPQELTKRIDLKDFQEKINYYTPAMTVFSLASPFYKGELWKVQGGIGKSYRTFKRSIVAPSVKIHPNRFEFKSFDMSHKSTDYYNFILLCLALLLDSGLLPGRADNASRIYELGSIAQFGFASPGISTKVKGFLEAIPSILEPWGIDCSLLKDLWWRVDHGITPADEMIHQFLRHQLHLGEIMSHRSNLISLVA